MLSHQFSEVGRDYIYLAGPNGRGSHCQHYALLASLRRRTDARLSEWARRRFGVLPRGRLGVPGGALECLHQSVTAASRGRAWRSRVQSRMNKHALPSSRWLRCGFAWRKSTQMSKTPREQTSGPLFRYFRSAPAWFNQRLRQVMAGIDSSSIIVDRRSVRFGSIRSVTPHFR